MSKQQVHMLKATMMNVHNGHTLVVCFALQVRSGAKLPTPVGKYINCRQAEHPQQHPVNLKRVPAPTGPLLSETPEESNHWELLVENSTLSVADIHTCMQMEQLICWLKLFLFLNL